MSLRGHIFEAKASLLAEYAGFIDAIGELCIGVDSIICNIVLIDDADTVLGYGDGGSLSILGYGNDPAAGFVVLREIALVIEPGFKNDVYGLVFGKGGTVIVDNNIMPAIAGAAETAAVTILAGIGGGVEILNNIAVQILDIEGDEACVTEQNELNIGESIKDTIAIGGYSIPVSKVGLAGHIRIAVDTEALFIAVAGDVVKSVVEAHVVDFAGCCLPVVSAVEHGGLVPIAYIAKEGDGEVNAVLGILGELNPAFEECANGEVFIEVAHKLFVCSDGHGDGYAFACGNGYGCGSVVCNHVGYIIDGTADEVDLGGLFLMSPVSGVSLRADLLDQCLDADGVGVVNTSDIVENKGEGEGTVLALADFKLRTA